MTRATLAQSQALATTSGGWPLLPLPKLPAGGGEPNFAADDEPTSHCCFI